MAKDRTISFESEPIIKASLRQMLPAVAAYMISLIYNLADTWFVGLLNDPRQTAAVTVVYPSFIMLTAISNLFGVGGAAAVARALGRKDADAPGRISSVSFWSGLAVSLIFTAVFSIFADPILRLCGATDKTIEFCLGYARYAVNAGGCFSATSMLFANLVRAEGSAFFASFAVSLGGLVNIAFDPFFILPRFLDMGVAGAGLATAISNAVSVAVFLIYLFGKRRTGVISLDPKQLVHARKHLGEILRIGFPSAAQYALTVVAIAAQASFVAKYRTEAVAALGIIKKLDNLPINFSIGVATGLLPLLAYNHAAGNIDRLKKAFRFGVTVALSFALTCLVAYEIYAENLAALFIKDETTIDYAAAFLRRMVTAMPLMSVCYPMIIRFQAMGRAKESLVCSLLRKGVLDIPLLFLMDALVPLYGLMWVQPIIDGISLTAALILSRKLFIRE